MLKGYVDSITTAGVSGWAADTDFPQQPIEILVFADDREPVWLRCDLHRRDLERSLGDGAHGFRYAFQPPLPEDRPCRVSIRYPLNGASLPGGEVLLGPRGSQPLPLFSSGEAASSLKLPLPKCPAEMLRLFALLDQTYGLYHLLSRIDFSGADYRSVHYAVWGRYPAKADSHDGMPPERLRFEMYRMLGSQDFQKNIIRWVLEACPDKQRMIFVHVPKCAGSDLSHHLLTRIPSIEHHLSERDWTPPDQLFGALANLARQLPIYDRILVRGHARLTFYTDQALNRPGDTIFTIVRDPVEMAISQVNYILTRINEDALGGQLQPDSRAWLQALDVNEESALGDAGAKHLASKILRNSDIVMPNPLTFWLGGGSSADIVERLTENKVEVASTENYAEWKRRRWHLNGASRHNESVKFISKESLAPKELEYIESISVADRELLSLMAERGLFNRDLA